MDGGAEPVLLVDDADRVRRLTLNRPEVLNACNEALWEALAVAFIAAADDPEVAVVLLTGNGRGFCAGVDLGDMATRIADPDSFEPSEHGFMGLIDVLTEFPKPLVIAVNGLGLGFGATVLGYADLAFMSSTARLKCPFTDLGVAPEAGSSATFPQMLGQQAATWVLMSSEWISADEAKEVGLVWRVTEPDDLLPEAHRHAAHLAAKPISSLIATKRTIMGDRKQTIEAARRREDAAFSQLMGGPANSEALAAFAEGRKPDFTDLPAGW